MSKMVEEPSFVVASVRNAFNSGRTRPLAFRKAQLTAILRLYEENTAAMLEALVVDSHKPKLEAVVSELDFIKNDVRNLLYNIDEWSQPDRPESPLISIMDELRIVKEPYGVVLIIGPWNYPLHLVLGPLAGAIAAGNCAIVKPSELAPASAKLIAQLLPKYLDVDCYRVVLGGIDETTALLKLRYDYIFYTGSTTVGRIVYRAANEFLTPVTLELGGKSPVYLDESADIQIAVNRILWGKCYNSGQSCLAPDYLLCTKQVQDKFVATFKATVLKWYGEKMKSSPDYGRIINQAHFNRLRKLLEGTQIACGGDFDADENYIAPTLVVDVQPQTDLIMQEEIFGPILPIVNIKDADEAIDFINRREKALAVYVFSTDRSVIDLFVAKTSSGGVCVNDVMMHFAIDTLPFGGVGNSGIGAYHGRYSFDTFSHHKSVVVKKLDKFGDYLQKARYPPYSESKLNFISNMTKKRRTIINFKHFGYFLVFGCGVLATLLAESWAYHHNQDKH